MIGPLQRMLRMPQFPQAPPEAAAPPIMPQPGLPGVDTGELERLYAELMRPPSFMERVAQGVQVPNQPMKKRKGRIARTALRGLVEGFKGSQGAGGRDKFSRSSSIRSLLGGGGGRAVNPEYEAARTAAARALETERLARAAQTNEPDDIDPLLEDKRAAIKALARMRIMSGDATRSRAGAYAGRQAKMGVAGKKAVTFEQERLMLNQRRTSELERLKGVITNMYGEVSGTYAKPLAVAAYARAAARVESDYQKRLNELNKKFGAGLPGMGEMNDEDEDELY